MIQNKTAAELARDMVGDGKKPNRYFVTIGFGWYVPRKVNPLDEDEFPEMNEAKRNFQLSVLRPH